MVHPDPSLWHCLGRFDWDAAQLRIASHPEEVQEVFDGKTTLIVACMSIVRRRQAPPIELFQEMINIRPDLIKEGAQPTGMTPLHFLFLHRHQSNRNLQAEVEGIARLLIETDPTCLKIEDANGWLPLHCLFSGRPWDNQFIRPDWLECVIAPYPQAIMTANKGGLKPFGGMFWPNYALNLNGRCILNPHNIAQIYYNEVNEGGHDDGDDNNDSTTWTQTNPNIWQCILATICCYEKYSTANSKENENEYEHNFMPLHTVASSKVATAEMVSLAVQIHRREMYASDREGNLPLHCACKRNNAHSTAILLQNDRNTARVKNAQGLLPLFLALRHEAVTWAHIKILLDAYSDALSEKDPILLLYPFVIVASHSVQPSKHRRCHRRREALNSLYQMIRLCPELI